ncbi:hypothetical protein LINPERHAP1_LOCUS6407 [Linum perenne]
MMICNKATMTILARLVKLSGLVAVTFGSGDSFLHILAFHATVRVVQHHGK